MAHCKLCTGLRRWSSKSIQQFRRCKTVRLGEDAARMLRDGSCRVIWLRYNSWRAGRPVNAESHTRCPLESCR